MKKEGINDFLPQFLYTVKFGFNDVTNSIINEQNSQSQITNFRTKINPVITLTGYNEQISLVPSCSL